jgi:DNA-binding CsgD family transcriptional regulator
MAALRWEPLAVIGQPITGLRPPCTGCFPIFRPSPERSEPGRAKRAPRGPRARLTVSRSRWPPSFRLVYPLPLSIAAVDRLVRTTLGGDPDRSFAEACFEATKGNPLFLRELLTTLAAAGIAPRAAHASEVLKVAPRSIARSVARRLRRLPQEAGELARAVAILGYGADLTAAAKLAKLDPTSAAAASTTLAQEDILSPETLEFVHPVVRATIYSELAAPQRARLHRAAAGILAERGAEDEVALHVLAAEPTGDQWVVDVLRRAARRAHSRGAPDVGVTYLERAISEPPADDQRVDLLVELGLTELAASRASGFARTREALELVEDPRARARVALEFGSSLFMWGNFWEAAKAFEEAHAELGGSDQELSQRLEAKLISASLPVPSLGSRLLDRLAPLMEDSDQVSDPILLAGLAMAVVTMIEPAEKGAELAERALAGGRLSIEDDPDIVALATYVLLAADRLDQAMAVWDRALADARRLGSFYLLGFAWTVRALVLVRVGAISAAEADARGALEGLGEDSRLLLTVPWVLVSLVDVLVECGELEEASGLLAEHGLTGELPDIFQMNDLLESRGRLRIAENRLEEGVADLRECGRRLEAWPPRNPGLLPWRASLARALAASGEREEALALARKEIELARAFELPRELGMALSAAGLVEGGERGIALLREAVAVLEVSPAELEHARALTDFGAALRRAGRRAEAREPLRAGLELARRCGASALAERAHEELVATGARPRRLVRSGVDALTASKRRVTELASEGLSNREIAQALFVSEKTVEGHLGHAYRKLDIGSRSQLPEALGGGRELAPR